MKRKIFIGLLFTILMISLMGCGTNKNSSEVASILSTSDIFTDRDLEQTVDISDAKTYTLKDDENIKITEAGIYVINGNAKNTSITINTDDDSKVQLVLSNLTITNESHPCIYVEKADKVFVTLTGNNSLTVSETFISAGTTNLDAVIFSKDDLVINGTGILNISSTDNGITSKDDLKITGGIINIDCTSDGLEANDSIAIKDGTITIDSLKDGLHAEYDDDDSIGYIYISGGTLNIKASDDAIHATTIVEIDGGKITTNSSEGIEGTYIQINDGIINLTASDDGINAGKKSNSYTPTIEINGGDITINMGPGDTDAIDSNGDLYINGGKLDITAQSPFDYDRTAQYNDGTIIVNGKETKEITNQMMGGRGGRGGRR